MLHQILQKWAAVSIPWADAWLDPMLGMAILLYLWKWEQQWLFGKQALNGLEVLVLTLVTAVFFEYFVPLKHPGFTSDWLDVVAYAAGSLIFWFGLNQTARDKEMLITG
ncbi:MAG: hypothetical protein GYB31_11935 [Bacteroidetes bacterium]|nr:hypothetical protein [Bacteroidota bacterium]